MGKKKSSQFSKNSNSRDLLLDRNEIQKLILKIRDFKPKITNNPFSKNNKPSEMHQNQEKNVFSELPLSKKILKGLRKSDYIEMTDIQRESLPYSISGYDVLGAAKTGSGKTLSFLIPVIERLYQLSWNPDMGLGALILVPTRELGLQIFEVLRKIGRYHKLSAGLVLGGKKNFNEETHLISKMNILVATPGRLLQHLNESFGFNGDNLQILVLDEADRLLEMGFENEINSIINYLNPNRQTLLFSATQDEKTRGLAKLSLRQKETQFISMIKEDQMPNQLKQLYTKIELYEKIDVLFSFLRKQTQHKSIVFVSTNAQVSFLYESFSKLPLGMKVYKLKGNMSQASRDEQFKDFSDVTAGVMFATDIASRGLDFPSITFVIQLDIPSNIDTYIHRSGRTARLKSSGFSIIFISPQEEEFINKLKEREIPIVEKNLNSDTLVSISDQLSSIVASNPKMKYLSMRYFEMFVKYTVKGMYCIKVDPSKYPLKEFSQRLGLFDMPNVRISVDKDGINKNKTELENDSDLDEDSEYDSEENDEDSIEEMNSEEEEEYINSILFSENKKAKLKETTKMEKLVKKKNTLQLSDKFKELIGLEETEDGEDFFIVKRNEKENDLFIEKKKDQKAYDKKIKKEHILVKNGKEMTAFEAVISEKQKISLDEIDSYGDKLKNEISKVDSEDKINYTKRKRSLDTKKEKNVEKEYLKLQRKEMTIIRDDNIQNEMERSNDIDDDYSSDVSMDEESYRNLIQSSRENVSGSNRRKFESLMRSMENEDSEDSEETFDDDNSNKNTISSPKSKKINNLNNVQEIKKSKTQKRKIENQDRSSIKKRRISSSTLQEKEELALQILGKSSLL